MEDRQDDRHAVQCFTCPRERRGDEPGWYFVDVPGGARRYGPARTFVCPRHYRHFAERERGRWREVGAPVIDAPVVEAPVVEQPALVATALPSAAWTEANRPLDGDAAPTDTAIAALGLLDTLVSDS